MKEYDQVFQEMDKVFKEVDKVFSQVDSIMAKATVVARKQEVGPWEPWFAWRPVKLQSKRVWMKKIYRRCINTYVDFDDWTRYEYGDIFDVIKDAK